MRIANIKQTITRVMLFPAGLAITLAMVAPPMPAAAAEDVWPCPANALCLWEHANAGGQRLVFMGPFATRGSCQNLTSYAGWNDRVSSGRNNLSYTARLVVHINCPNNLPSGDYEWFSPNTQHNVSWTRNDELSSIKFL